MDNRTSKLQALQQLLQHREDQAQRQLGRRVQEVDAAHSKAEELDGLQQEYSKRLCSAGGAGLSAADLRLWRRFAASMGDVVEVQGAQVDQLRRQLEEAQKAWLAAYSRRKGGELLLEGAQRRQALKARRQERVESSDMAARRRRNQQS